MTEVTHDGTGIPLDELEARLRELQEIWADANTHRDEPVVTADKSPRLTPTKPQTPPSRRSPRAFGPRNRDMSALSYDGVLPAPVASSTSALPAVRSSTGLLGAPKPLTPPSAPLHNASSWERESSEPTPLFDPVQLPTLAKRRSRDVRICHGCGQVPPRAVAKFCSFCGRRLSDA